MERSHHNMINKIGRIVVDFMMLVLLWGILVLPVSTFSLFKVEEQPQHVLSEQHSRSDETSTYRELESNTEDTTRVIGP